MAERHVKSQPGQHQKKNRRHNHGAAQDLSAMFLYFTVIFLHIGIPYRMKSAFVFSAILPRFYAVYPSTAYGHYSMCVFPFHYFLFRQNQPLTGVDGIFILNTVDLAELVQHCRCLIYFPADSHKTISLLHIVISL